MAEVVDQLTMEQGGQKMPRIEINALPQVNADPELLQRVLANLINDPTLDAPECLTPA